MKSLQHKKGFLNWVKRKIVKRRRRKPYMEATDFSAALYLIDYCDNQQSLKVHESDLDALANYPIMEDPKR